MSITMANDTATRANQAGWGLGTDGQPWNSVLPGGAPAALTIASNELLITGVAGTYYYTLYGGTTGQTPYAPLLYNFDMFVRLKTSASNDQAGFLFDYFNNANNCYVALLSNEIVLDKTVANTKTLIGVTTTVTFTAGTWYRVHLNVTGNVAKFWFWIDGGTQTVTPQLTVTDNVFLGGGSYGLMAQTPTNGDTVQCDSFSVTANAGTTMYVDPVNGNDSNNGQTIPTAWASIAHASAVSIPGTIVQVLPGTQTGTGANGITTNACGVPNARLQYVSATPWTANIRSTGGNLTSTWTNNGAYTDIIGFDVSGDGQSGIVVSGSYPSVQQCKVHDIPCTGSGGGGGIVLNTSTATAITDGDILGNLVYNIGYNDTTGQFIQGIYHTRLRGNIKNNLVFNCSGFGIQLWHAATNITISNNLVANNACGGIVVGAGDAPGGVTCDNCIVNDNIVINNNPVIDVYGTIGLQIHESGLTGTHNVYQNNLIFGTSAYILLQNGLVATGTITADPLFVNYLGTGLGDYHLKAGSPAINAGTSSGAPLTDRDGALRSVKAAIDIGPYLYFAHALFPATSRRIGVFPATSRRTGLFPATSRRQST